MENQEFIVKGGQMEMGAAVRLRLAEILRKRNMTQRELSQKTGLSENAISKLTGSPRQVRLDTLDILCDALDLAPGELFERENNGKQAN